MTIETIKIIADCIGWIGNFCFITGAFYLAQKKTSGFWLQIGGNLAYAIQGFLFRTSSLWAVSIALILVNIWGIYTWTHMGKIGKTLQTIEYVWRQNPRMRLSNLLISATGQKRFMKIKDEALRKRLRKFYDEEV